LRIGIDESPEDAHVGASSGNAKYLTGERSYRMTARKLIQLLETVPPNTRIPVEPSVISTLKGKVQNQIEYVSEAEQDRIDAELLRKRSKADRKLVDWEKVKQRYGVR
jgi:hypothetical protein